MLAHSGTDKSPLTLSHNTVVCLEHFTHPALQPVLREVWGDVRPNGIGWTPARPERKTWEVAMAVRALREHGALHANAEILGVGSGTEATIFALTLHVRRVFATDLYLDQGDWERTAVQQMLVDPRKVWAGAFDPRRLVVQHMNALDLRYTDESFDGVFSSSSIEHFGDFDAVSQSMDEIYRVLRPGGVFSCSTEFRLDGQAPGLPGTLMFDRQQILDYIIGDRKWELVGGDLQLVPSPETLAVKVPVSLAVEDVKSGRTRWSVYPHLVLTHDHVCWTSIHFILRKRLAAED